MIKHLCNPAEKQVMDWIDKQEKRPLLLGIDGRCASGKTTLADEIQKRSDCFVIHMDHFFLQPFQRTKERLQTPGENVDHERFLKEVIEPFQKGEIIRYSPFQCATQSFGKVIQIQPNGILLIEGSYCCHPTLCSYYDYRIFLTVSKEEQLRRLALREGEEKLEVFKSKWIPLEEAYFDSFQIEKSCDAVISTDLFCQ